MDATQAAKLVIRQIFKLLLSQRIVPSEYIGFRRRFLTDSLRGDGLRWTRVGKRETVMKLAATHGVLNRALTDSRHK